MSITIKKRAIGIMQYLEKYNKMKFAIQECHKVDEIKLIRDKAEVYRYAMIQAKESPEYIKMAEEIKLRAERKAGELLKEMPKQKPGEYQRLQATTVALTLKEQGITKGQSSNWQRIANIPEDIFENYIQASREITTSGAVRMAKKLEIERWKREDQIKEKLSIRPKIYHCDYRDFLDRIENNSQDLLITDPPYSTDIEDIEEFVNDWVIKALDKVKPTGRSSICIGAYPRELKAYLNILLSQKKFILDNPLIWTYRNTLGQTPKMKYNLNYQVILHLYSDQSRKLDTKITNEMFSVQDINAPDGRQGNRYHTWQKPTELARRLITHATKEGDKIFDCFAGTGTFILMGAKLGRKVMGCDNSRDMLKIAEERGCEII